MYSRLLYFNSSYPVIEIIVYQKSQERTYSNNDGGNY
jgi:hypothetical protein